MFLRPPLITGQSKPLVFADSILPASTSFKNHLDGASKNPNQTLADVKSQYSERMAAAQAQAVTGLSHTATGVTLAGGIAIETMIPDPIEGALWTIASGTMVLPQVGLPLMAIAGGYTTIKALMKVGAILAATNNLQSGLSNLVGSAAGMISATGGFVSGVGSVAKDRAVATVNLSAELLATASNSLEDTAKGVGRRAIGQSLPKEGTDKILTQAFGVFSSKESVIRPIDFKVTLENLISSDEFNTSNLKDVAHWIQNQHAKNGGPLLLKDPCFKFIMSFWMDALKINDQETMKSWYLKLGGGLSNKEIYKQVLILAMMIEDLPFSGKTSDEIGEMIQDYTDTEGNPVYGHHAILVQFYQYFSPLSDMEKTVVAYFLFSEIAKMQRDIQAAYAHQNLMLQFGADPVSFMNGDDYYNAPTRLKTLSLIGDENHKGIIDGVFLIPNTEKRELEYAQLLAALEIEFRNPDIFLYHRQDILRKILNEANADDLELVHMVIASESILLRLSGSSPALRAMVSDGINTLQQREVDRTKILSVQSRLDATQTFMMTAWGQSNGVLDRLKERFNSGMAKASSGLFSLWKRDEKPEDENPIQDLNFLIERWQSESSSTKIVNEIVTVLLARQDSQEDLQEFFTALLRAIDSHHPTLFQAVLDLRLVLSEIYSDHIFNQLEEKLTAISSEMNSESGDHREGESSQEDNNENDGTKSSRLRQSIRSMRLPDRLPGLISKG